MYYQHHFKTEPIIYVPPVTFIIFNFNKYKFIFNRIFCSKFTNFFLIILPSLISPIFFLIFMKSFKSHCFIYFIAIFFVSYNYIYTHSVLLYFRQTMSYNLIVSKGVTSLLCLFFIYLINYFCQYFHL